MKNNIFISFILLISIVCLTMFMGCDNFTSNSSDFRTRNGLTSKSTTDNAGEIMIEAPLGTKVRIIDLRTGQSAIIEARSECSSRDGNDTIYNLTIDFGGDNMCDPHYINHNYPADVANEYSGSAIVERLDRTGQSLFYKSTVKASKMNGAPDVWVKFSSFGLNPFTIKKQIPNTTIVKTINLHPTFLSCMLTECSLPSSSAIFKVKLDSSGHVLLMPENGFSQIGEHVYVGSISNTLLNEYSMPDGGIIWVRFPDSIDAGVAPSAEVVDFEEQDGTTISGIHIQSSIGDKIRITDIRSGEVSVLTMMSSCKMNESENFFTYYIGNNSCSAASVNSKFPILDENNFESRSFVIERSDRIGSSVYYKPMQYSSNSISIKIEESGIKLLNTEVPSSLAKQVSNLHPTPPPCKTIECLLANDVIVEVIIKDYHIKEFLAFDVRESIYVSGNIFEGAYSSFTPAMTSPKTTYSKLWVLFPQSIDASVAPSMQILDFMAYINPDV